MVAKINNSINEMSLVFFNQINDKIRIDEIVNNLKNLLNVTANKIVLENSEISKNMYPNKENK